jgi:dinuclear metal center YbgI/SA1388 family protein
MTILEITEYLETIAPLQFQENYDNAGLIVGESSSECTGIIISLDVTEAVINEAISSNCNMVVAHHPIIFKGLKQITGKNYIERTIIKAIKNDISIYAIHTNLDNVKKGVNGKIAERIGLQNLQLLQPKENILKKLIVFAPFKNAEDIRKSLFAAGAGKLGKYSECSFNSEGKGTFKAEQGAAPYVGEIGKQHEEKEIKIEVIFPGYLEQKIIRAMIESHPYEEVAYDIISLGNYVAEIGSGLIGEMDKAVDENDFLEKIKAAFGLKVIKHTAFSGKKVKKVAICGGAGNFLISSALSNQADIYITSDIKYHEFFEAEGLVLIDIGHYESEQFTIDLLYEFISEKYPNFAVRKTEVITNPVNYFL